jgi:hypothetical protein
MPPIWSCKLCRYFLDNGNKVRRYKCGYPIMTNKPYKTIKKLRENCRYQQSGHKSSVTMGMMIPIIDDKN